MGPLHGKVNESRCLLGTNVYQPMFGLNRGYPMKNQPTESNSMSLLLLLTGAQGAGWILAK